jgi:hypothetical protein
MTATAAANSDSQLEESNNQPLVVSQRSESPVILNERFQQYGYLHFKKTVAKEKCDQLLHRILKQLSPHIVFDESLQLPVLTGEPFFETDPIWDDVYPKIQSLYEFHQFFHQDDLTQLMKILVGDRPFVYPMKMGRIATPKKLGFETPPHQDAHSHQAGPTMAGMWVALHDAKKGLGRLKLLAGSHKGGVRKVFNAEGVGGVQCEIYEQENEWHVSDVGQGDIIVFHSCCVHKAEPNTSEETVRISIDTRFCDYGAPVFTTNLEPHHGWRIKDLDWQHIYREWTDSALQYYWQDYPNLFSQPRI